MDQVRKKLVLAVRPGRTARKLCLESFGARLYEVE